MEQHILSSTTMVSVGDQCPVCRGYITTPLAWWAVSPPPMCNCPKPSRFPNGISTIQNPMEDLMKRIQENVEKGKKPFSDETPDTKTILQQILTSQQQTLACLQELSETMKLLVGKRNVRGGGTAEVLLG